MDTSNQGPMDINQTSIPTNTASTTASHKNSVLIILVLIVVAAFAWFGYSRMNKVEITSELKAQADQGKLVAGFPGGLIVVQDATILFSKHDTFNSKLGSADSYTTQYTTKSLPDVLVKLYSDYMKNNGYEAEKSNVVGNEKMSMIGRRKIGATNENLSINIYPPVGAHDQSRVHIILIENK